MKKIISLILVCILLFSFTSCKKEVISYKDNLDLYIKELDYHDDFTILQLTDIHWSTGTQIGDGNYGSIGYLKKLIDETKNHAGHIDLIEVTGDTFMLANKNAVNEFINFMEELDIPYAMTWGNHDREGIYNPNWLSNKFIKANNSLYTEVFNDDVHERCNYIINLVSGNDIKWQISHLDSGASYREGALDLSLTYDYIRDSQYEWLKAESDYANNPPMICYYHIDQTDYQNAYNAILNGAEGYKTKFFKLEGFAPSKYATPANDVFKACNVKASFIGHAHANDWTFTNPDGITYGLGVKSGTELYYFPVEKGYKDAGFEVEEGFDLIGASLVTLNDDKGNFSLEHLYLNERDEGDFILWVNYDD